jgi:hypothetical protein
MKSTAQKAVDFFCADFILVLLTVNMKTKPLNKLETTLYKRLKRSAKEIKQFKEGEIQLQDAKGFLKKL